MCGAAMKRYVIARTASKKPTLMHQINPQDTNMTVCGWDMSAWSLVYFEKAFDVLMCRRCCPK